MVLVAAACAAVELTGCSSSASDAISSAAAPITQSTIASSTASTVPSTLAPSSGGSPYFLLDDPAWTLQEAIDLKANEPFVTAEKPPLDWYAEYAPASGADAQVSVSGYAVALDEARRQGERYGYQFHHVTVDGWQAIGSTGPGSMSDPPAVVLLATSDGSSIRLLSTELSLEDLTRLAASLKRTDAAGWVGAGGVVD